MAVETLGVAGDLHAASKTISPATMVSFTLPSMRASSKGVFLPRESMLNPHPPDEALTCRARTAIQLR
ncbi:MAG: hypothetical protein CR217_14775 [Beijerinckiaceae bacterium]|nr:MAG: hypothetical protein CR217_14775 [Beijerinckiaceae bacterium]